MGKVLVSYERESKLPDWATPGVILAMYQEGKSLRNLEKVLGVSRTTIGKIIREAKVKRDSSSSV